MKIPSGAPRRSKAREAILAVLRSARSPLSVAEIELAITRSGHRFNKTTVYRELERLSSSDMIHELSLRNDRALYELAGPHHHHLVCVGCGEVRDIDAWESFEEEERRIERQEGYKVLDHALEFLGLCCRCQRHGAGSVRKEVSA